MMTKEQIAQRLSAYQRKKISRKEFPGSAQASVLIPLFSSQDGLSVILTVRTHEVETHKGQISFPGGMADSSDMDVVHTALRETNEELQIEEHTVEVLGLLDDHPTPTKFVVTPVVGYMNERPRCVPNPSEVAEVLEVPLSLFMDESNIRTELRELHGKKVNVLHIQYGKHDIWGATAMMMKNLTDVISGKH